MSQMVFVLCFYGLIKSSVSGQDMFPLLGVAWIVLLIHCMHVSAQQRHFYKSCLLRGL